MKFRVVRTGSEYPYRVEYKENWHSFWKHITYTYHIGFIDTWVGLDRHQPYMFEDVEEANSFMEEMSKPGVLEAHIKKHDDKYHDICRQIREHFKKLRENDSKMRSIDKG